MFVFDVFAALLIWLGILSLRGGVRFLRYVQTEIRANRANKNYAPFAAIVAPCRGLDENLSENLSALLEQNYPAYEVIFVVDDERDASAHVIKEILAQNQTPNSRVKAKLIVAGKAVESSQKVHNLRRAIMQISDDAEVLAFVDSDARAAENWLSFLVAPLADKKIGATTGYRWFVSKRGRTVSHLRAVWNASIASALGAQLEKNFCWGGATAIRRETFEKLNMLEKWRGAASDDFALTNALQTANLPIYFVPQCLMAAIEDCTFTELLEFSTRQMKITRVYAAHLWKAAFIGSFLFASIFWSGFLIVIYRALEHQSFWLPLGLLLVIFAFGAAKAELRLRAVKLMLPQHKKHLDKSALWHLTLWTITPFLYFYNCLAAAFSRNIVWRGIAYELKSPTETIITKFRE